jgi:hypothetical protein
LKRELIAEKAIVHSDLALHGPTIVDRTFELPRALYAMTVGLFLAFLGVMTIGFGNPELALPMVLFAFTIVAGFGICTIWATMKPEKDRRALSWNTFSRTGIQIATGRITAKEASIQVLMLPLLIFLWGIAAVIIAALV